MSATYDWMRLCESILCSCNRSSTGYISSTILSHKYMYDRFECTHIFIYCLVFYVCGFILLIFIAIMYMRRGRIGCCARCVILWRVKRQTLTHIRPLAHTYKHNTNLQRVKNSVEKGELAVNMDDDGDSAMDERDNATLQ